MKKGLFIDTWGWVTLHNKREPRHGEIKAFYLSFSLAKKSVAFLDERLFGRDICMPNGLHLKDLSKQKSFV